MSFTLGNAESQASGKQQQKSGFVVAGDSGTMRVFFKSEADPRMPYKRADGEDLHFNSSESEKDKMLINDVMYHKITNMALSQKQDCLLFSTDANQILKVQINLERPYEVDSFNYLISSFHSKGVVDLDVCIKKQLIATCATDRTVRLWSFN